MIELLEFGAPWCPPCRAMEPVLEALEAEGHNITQIDSDRNPALVSQYMVTALPTIIILRDGEVVSRIVGARDKRFLDAELANAAL